MRTYHLEVDTKPTVQDGEFLEDQLSDSNVTQTGYDDGQLMTIWVKSHADEIMAGLHGWTWGGSCAIRDLWVHEDLRGQGCDTQYTHILGALGLGMTTVFIRFQPRIHGEVDGRWYA